MSSQDKMIKCLTIAVASVLVGCHGSIFDSDAIERTYPNASDFPLTTVHEILSNQVEGNCNIDAYVVGVNICPEGSLCFLPDGISIADEYVVDPPYESIHIPLNQPGQFVVGKRYTLSVKVELFEVADSDSTWQVARVQLLGYDFLSNRSASRIIGLNEDYFL
jgi:hypothetical protein